MGRQAVQGRRRTIPGVRARQAGSKTQSARPVNSPAVKRPGRATPFELTVEEAAAEVVLRAARHGALGPLLALWVDGDALGVAVARLAAGACAAHDGALGAGAGAAGRGSAGHKARDREGGVRQRRGLADLHVAPKKHPRLRTSAAVVLGATFRVPFALLAGLAYAAAVVNARRLVGGAGLAVRARAAADRVAWGWWGQPGGFRAAG
jgi:hypothetical protein